MSALIAKEIYSFFKEQKIYIIFGIIMLIFEATNAPEVCMVFIIVSGTFASTSIITDERSGWDKTSKLLPVSNAAAVAAKYIYGSMHIILSSALFSAVIVLSGKPKGTIAVCIIAMIFASLLQAVDLPLGYVFSSNARTIACCLLTGLIYGIAAGFMPYEKGDVLNSDILNSAVFKMIFSAKPITLFLLALAVTIVLNVISYLISLVIFSRKEF